ncbi:polyhydroxyalkanoate synthesis regulator phasin [Ancylobacter sp. 3268]|uniref:hypothetical protein n=1 Tax=Ancylobacter sp. 3268 TaxID=2817752 RepID=UPI0028583407|nr:hypothetical protein [Ancylobacter sp. 3268]MDR6954104.1 polyhydroxyalkanoate synthesis regulator phasin [Ancylobacter sp. 3268]
MDLILQKLIEWGPGGLLAAFFGWLLVQREKHIEALQQRINDLQDKRVEESREDVAKMSTALVTSTEAMDANKESIDTLRRVVEAGMNRGGSR